MQIIKECLKYQASNVEKQDRKKPHTHTINNKDKGKYSKTKPSIPGCNGCRAD